MKSLRLFVAVNPAPHVRGRLKESLARVRRLAPSARWVDVGSMHVTLVFLGHTPDEMVAELETTLGKAARLRSPFDLQVRGAGVFGGSSPHVLWTAVAGDVDALTAVQRDLVTAITPLGWTPEDRPYSPHLTLARSRERRGDRALAACADALAGEDFGLTRVDAAVLYRSDLTHTGPRYTQIAVFPFSG